MTFQRISIVKCGRGNEAFHLSPSHLLMLTFLLLGLEYPSFLRKALFRELGAISKMHLLSKALHYWHEGVSSVFLVPCGHCRDTVQKQRGYWNEDVIAQLMPREPALPSPLWTGGAINKSTFATGIFLAKCKGSSWEAFISAQLGSPKLWCRIQHE